MRYPSCVYFLVLGILFGESYAETPSITLELSDSEEVSLKWLDPSKDWVLQKSLDLKEWADVESVGLPVSASYSLGGQFSVFEAKVGLDTLSDLSPVRFRAYVDTELAYDSGWIDRTSLGEEVSIDLEGARDLQLVFNGDAESVALGSANWGDAKLLVSKPGLRFAYYEIYLMESTADIVGAPVTTGISSTFEITGREQDDNFAFAFDGFIEISTAGSYTFYTSSDDGSLLSIDGVKVVDNDGRHAPQEASGTVYLEVGFYPLKLLYFERGGAKCCP